MRFWSVYRIVVAMLAGVSSGQPDSYGYRTISKFECRGDRRAETHVLAFFITKIINSRRAPKTSVRWDPFYVKVPQC